MILWLVLHPDGQVELLSHFLSMLNLILAISRKRSTVWPAAPLTKGSGRARLIQAWGRERTCWVCGSEKKTRASQEAKRCDSSRTVCPHRGGKGCVMVKPCSPSVVVGVVDSSFKGA